MAEGILSGKRSEIGRGSKAYPEAFSCLESPPDTLYVIGDEAALTEGLAIVGARKASPYGIGCARRFGEIAANAGISIISGGARGCDAAAHQAAVSAKGKTVAFLGGGCDKIYPRQNYKLFQEIIDCGGAVASEHPWDAPALPHYFRERNRLIASLARATLIVEAGLPSGTFSTADEALAANREVLVVPGAITNPNCQGSNRLLYQGAEPIVDDESFCDALMRIFGIIVLKPGATQGEGKWEGDFGEVLLALSAEPLRADDLLLRLNAQRERKMGTAELARYLIEAETKGLVTRYDDGRFAVKVQKG